MMFLLALSPTTSSVQTNNKPDIAAFTAGEAGDPNTADYPYTTPNQLPAARTTSSRGAVVANNDTLTLGGLRDDRPLVSDVINSIVTSKDRATFNVVSDCEGYRWVLGTRTQAQPAHKHAAHRL